MSKAQAYHRDAIILGGERGGDLIPGFDLGNSPADYTANEVFGRTVLFTTTNGTRAIVYAHLASRVLIGAAVNRQAVADAAATEDAVDIVCAGTGGSVTREDILAAGAIVDSMIASAGPGAYKTNRWALSAAREWQELQTAARALGRTESAQLAQELRNTQGGKNLVALGFDHDLEACAQLDTLDVVPELDRKTGQVR